MSGLRKVTFLLASVFLAAPWASSALADKRVALLIGNADYRANIARLKNPGNDAPDLAQQLRAIGFEVILKTDAGMGAFSDALAELSRKAAGADAVLFYYAGHGLQHDGQNYFLPIDIDVQDAADVEYKAIAMDKVLAAVNKSNGVKIVVLDACRDNPLAKQLATRSIGDGGESATRGLARIDKTKGLIIAYATAPNEVAMDGNGRNSPFTEALINRLKEPGVEVGMVFRRVTSDVIERTNGRQRPETSISLGGEYYLNPTEGDSFVWNRVRRSEDPAELQDFIKRFPASPYARDAQDRLDLFERIRRVNEERQNQEKAAAAEKAEAQRREAERIVAEKAKAEAEARRLAEERIAAEKAKAEAEAKRLAEEKIAAEKARMEADAKRLAEERERLAAEKTKAEAEARRLAQEQAAGEKARAEREAERLADDRIAAEQAKAKLATEQVRQFEEQEKRRVAELCKREGDELRKLGVARRPEAIEEFAKRATCPTIGEALEREKRAGAAAVARACDAERTQLAGVKDVEALRNAVQRLSCETVRDEARQRIARLDDEALQKERLCSEETKAFNAIDAGALDAPAHYVVLRNQSSCATLRPQLDEAIAKVTQRVKDAQAQLKRLSCYNGLANGNLDEATQKSMSLYFSKKGKNDASPRLTDEFLAELKTQQIAVCHSSEPIAAAPDSANESQKIGEPTLTKLLRQKQQQAAKEVDGEHERPAIHKPQSRRQEEEATPRAKQRAPVASQARSRPASVEARREASPAPARQSQVQGVGF